MENGVSGVSELFQSLENLLIGQEPALHKKSLLGRLSVEKNQNDVIGTLLFTAILITFNYRYLVVYVWLSVVSLSTRF